MCVFLERNTDVKGKSTAWTRSISKLKFIRANVKEHRRRGVGAMCWGQPSLGLPLQVTQQWHKTAICRCKFPSSSFAPKGKVPKLICSLSCPLGGKNQFYSHKIVHYVQTSNQWTFENTLCRNLNNLRAFFFSAASTICNLWLPCMIELSAFVTIPLLLFLSFFCT